jgi:hypothetical protein
MSQRRKWEEEESEILNKGLDNKFGENNCFLNVVIQSLWHLKDFRNNFKKQEKHVHSKEANSCIFCALEVIFTQFDYSENESLPPTALREALSQVFVSQERFQVGKLADAAEAFVRIVSIGDTSLVGQN